MSYITDAVLFVDMVSDEAKVAIEAPLPFDSERTQRFGKLDTGLAGGSKVFCSDVYAAAFNHIDTDELEAWFRALPWGAYSVAFLAWSTECGEFRGRVERGPERAAWGWL